MRYKWFALWFRHKWFVFLAGRKTKCSLWRLIKHDWTKLLPCEFIHYSRRFYGNVNDPEGFGRCWLHHQNHNDHHWEYWIPRTIHNRADSTHIENQPLPMIMGAVREMVADWMGASRTYNGEWPKKDDWPWFKDNWPKIKTRLHANTVKAIENIMLNAGYSKVLKRAYYE